jgi:hypothetical protein
MVFPVVLTYLPYRMYPFCHVGSRCGSHTVCDPFLGDGAAVRLMGREEEGGDITYSCRLFSPASIST